MSIGSGMSSYKYDKALGVKLNRDIPTKDRKSANKSFWKRKVVEFCERTEFHGFKYIVMEGLSVVERICWAVAVVLSIIFATYFVVSAYKWYARNPIVTVIESTQGAIWDIPFPAITICDLNSVSRKGAKSFSNYVTLPVNVTADDVFEAVKFAPLLHSPFMTSAEQKQHLHLLQQVLDFNQISLEELFHKLSPVGSCNKMLQRCMWKNTIYHCDDLFRQVMTMYKVCCAFNYFAVAHEVEMHQGHQEPRRVASCGYQTALTVLLKTDPGDYYSALLPSQGALVLIDSAYNIPNADSPMRMVNPFTELLVALSPERTYTTSGIRSFGPAERQCMYSDEAKIPGFSQYSLHNCVAFQRIENTKRKCDCVPFYFPNHDQMRICNFNDMECLESSLNAEPRGPGMWEQKAGSSLGCLPECEHYDYPVEVAMGKLATDLELTGLPLFNDVDLGNCSLLNIFFNDLVSTRFRRDVYFNWQNFTAAFGGLLSLMLGFTLISFLDMVIFFTLRLAYESFPGKTQLLTDSDKKINNWIEKSIRIESLYDNDFGIRKPKNMNLNKHM